MEDNETEIVDGIGIEGLEEAISEMEEKLRKQKEKEEELSYCLGKIKEIQNDYTFLQSERLDALRFYNSDSSIVPVIKERSQMTTTDLFDTIEWIKPAILEIFASSDEVLALQPETEEDVEPVKRMELLVNKQIRSKNNWFSILYDAFTDGMIEKTGVVKYQWVKDTKTIDREYQGLDELEYNAKQQEANYEITDVEEIIAQEAEINMMTGVITSPAVKEYNIKGRYVIEDEYPLIEAVPPEDIGFKLNARKIENTFFYHRVIYNKYEFIEKYGKDSYENIKNDSGRDSSADNIRDERIRDLGGMPFFYNKEKDEIYTYECYYPNKETSEAWLTVICGNEVLRSEKNRYDKPNFEIFSPVRIPHRICGKSFYDLLKDIQKIRTFLLRQILDNTCMANYRRYFVDASRINLDDYLNNNVANAMIRTTGDPSTIVMAERKAELPQEVFNFFEMINTEKDYHSGMPRSFQGVNPDILNETFRGQAQQVQQASQRIQLLARIMAETFVAPLVENIINLNLKFLQKKTSVRFLNEWVEINPDNIIGKYDIEVKVGLGTGNKSLQVSQLQQVLGLYNQVANYGIVKPDNAYNTMKELLRVMGYRNTSDFVSDPKVGESVKGIIKILVQIMQQFGVQDPKIAELVQKTMASFGIKPEEVLPPKPPQQQPGQGTFPGQNVAPQPAIPAQPMQDRSSAMDGGEFWS